MFPVVFYTEISNDFLQAKQVRENFLYCFIAVVVNIPFNHVERMNNPK